MKTEQKTRSLKSKFIFAGLSICVASLCVVSITSYLISHNIISKEINTKTSEATHKFVNQINTFFVENGKELHSIVEDKEIHDYDDKFLKRYLNGKYQRLKNNDSPIIDIYVGFTDKKMLTGSNWVPPPDYDCTTRPWYILAMEKQRLVFTVPYLDARTKEMIVTISEPIRRRGKIIAVAAADMYVTDVTKVVRQAQPGKDSYAFLLDNKNNIIIHRNKSFLPTEKGLENLANTLDGRFRSLARHVKEQSYAVLEITDYDGIDRYFFFGTIISPGWTFGMAIAKSEYTTPLYYLLFGFVFAMLFSLAVGIFIVRHSTNNLVEPIRGLRNTVRRFADRDFSARSMLSSPDEIGELGRSFNIMADTIQEYSEKLEQKIRERTEELLLSNKKLEESNRQITDSIAYARMIQSSILPREEEIKKSFKDIFIFWKPKNIVGGDFYYFKVTNGNRLIAIVDCTGHNVPGAFMTMMVNSILNHIIDDICSDNPSKILRELNRIVRATLHHDQNDQSIDNGLDIGLCYLDGTRNALLFAGAKISLYFSKEGIISEIKGERKSIGYKRTDVEFEYKNNPVEIEPGMTFYLVTDGFLNQVSGKGGHSFGNRRFMELLKACMTLPVAEQKKIIAESLSNYMRGTEQRDDITLLGFVV